MVKPAARDSSNRATDTRVPRTRGRSPKCSASATIQVFMPHYCRNGMDKQVCCLSLGCRRLRTRTEHLSGHQADDRASIFGSPRGLGLRQRSAAFGSATRGKAAERCRSSRRCRAVDCSLFPPRSLALTGRQKFILRIAIGTGPSPVYSTTAIRKNRRAVRRPRQNGFCYGNIFQQHESKRRTEGKTR